MRPVIGVVGASARAAVMSLARFGTTAWAVDLFGDRDLLQLAPTTICPLSVFPFAFPELVRAFPPGPFLYTGGLENHPDVVHQLCLQRKLIGNSPEALLLARDRTRLRQQLDRHQFLSPDELPSGSRCPEQRGWLLKPERSAGGLGIRTAHLGEIAPPGYYFQRLLQGLSRSVVYHEAEGQARIFGITEQLTGTPWLHAKGYHYTGSIGPVEVSPLLEQELLRLGALCVSSLGLCDVFGIDFLLHDEQLWVLEVNPRYTASVEVLELARRESVWSPTCSACGPSEGVIGKAIYYAPKRIVFPSSGSWDAELAKSFDPWCLPRYADIPAGGSVIELGHPVLTLFASAPTQELCRRALQSRARKLDELLQVHLP